MLKWNHLVWIGAASLFLVGCGSSSSGSSEDPVAQNPIDNSKVTMPDGTVVDRPNVGDIRPDFIPVEMEAEYNAYVDDTMQLRDPQDNVYEILVDNGDGADSRAYLVTTHRQYGRLTFIEGWPSGHAFAFTDRGECYAQPEAKTYNAPLHGAPIVFLGREVLEEEVEHIVRIAEGSEYRLTLDLVDTALNEGGETRNWELSWQLGEHGFIDRIALLDTEGEVIEIADRTDGDEYLEHSWEDAGQTVSIKIPFEPIDREILSPAQLLESTCEIHQDEYSAEIQNPVVYEGTEDHEYSVIAFEASDSYRLSVWTFVKAGEGYGECLSANPSRSGLIHGHHYRFSGPYVEWDERYGEGEGLEGLKFEDGILIESSNGTLNPEKSELSWEELQNKMC